MILLVHHHGAALVGAHEYTATRLALGQLTADQVAFKEQFALKRVQLIHSPAQKILTMLHPVKRQYRFVPDAIAHLFGGPTGKGSVAQIARETDAAANNRPLIGTRFQPPTVALKKIVERHAALPSSCAASSRALLIWSRSCAAFS